jgi:3-hydroxyacyl-[acyl-carrier-protein] dehydratase
MPNPSNPSDTFVRVEKLMRRDLKLGSDIAIDEQTPFFGSSADIDSLDILLLLGSIEKEFGLKIPSEAVGREVFKNVGTLVRYIDEHRGAASAGAQQARPAGAQADPLSRLPHGEAFRFVSRVTQVREGQSARGVWAVTGKEHFFSGHFPGRPVVPGVLLAEALAQISGLSGAWGARADVRLAHADVRFDQAVVPPAEIVLESRFVREMGTLRQYEVSATVAGAVVARGTIALSAAPSGAPSGGPTGAAAGRGTSK